MSLPDSRRRHERPIKLPRNVHHRAAQNTPATTRLEGSSTYNCSALIAVIRKRCRRADSPTAYSPVLGRPENRVFKVAPLLLHPHPSSLPLATLRRKVYTVWRTVPEPRPSRRVRIASLVTQIGNSYLRGAGGCSAHQWSPSSTCDDQSFLSAQAHASENWLEVPKARTSDRAPKPWSQMKDTTKPPSWALAVGNASTPIFTFPLSILTVSLTMSPMAQTLLATLAAASTAYAGSIADIEHVVLFMQENRAFGTHAGHQALFETVANPAVDHYFGTMVQHSHATTAGRILTVHRLASVASRTLKFREEFVLALVETVTSLLMVERSTTANQSGIRW